MGRSLLKDLNGTSAVAIRRLRGVRARSRGSQPAPCSIAAAARTKRKLFAFMDHRSQVARLAPSELGQGCFGLMAAGLCLPLSKTPRLAASELATHKVECSKALGWLDSQHFCSFRRPAKRCPNCGELQALLEACRGDGARPEDKGSHFRRQLPMLCQRAAPVPSGPKTGP